MDCAASQLLAPSLPCPRLPSDPLAGGVRTTQLRASAVNCSTLARRAKSQPAHLCDELPLLRSHRLHRQTRIFHERHVGEFFLRLDRANAHRFWQRLLGLDVDADEFAGLVRRIGIGLPDHLGDADDLLAFVGMIEKRLVALLHVHEILPRGEIAHAGPSLAFCALGDLLIPRPARRFGFQEPIRHAHSSALKGRVSRPSIAASMVVVPLRIAATALDTGISTFCEAASSTSTGAVNSPSASFPGAGLAPRPSARPRAKLRDCGLEQVRIRSPSPERPTSVSLRAPSARPKRASSEKPRVVSAACAEAPKLLPTTMPAAIASTFFAAPPISTPRTSLV